MNYLSTRGDSAATGASAIAQGLARDGGLFCPAVFPQLTFDKLKELAAQPYYVRAAYVLSLYLDEYTPQELVDSCRLAYATFEEAAPLTHLTGKISMLELWHGPTSAFKDIALQLLPDLLHLALKKTGEKRRVCVLTATSGDTGKASLEGFKNREGFGVYVFYPANGVSRAQRLQMVTQTGKNVGVAGIRGNFDDAQAGVKAIFADATFAETLAKENWKLSSANSINLGRLLPQIAYYVSAYCDLCTEGVIRWGESIDVTVPTGNFGNILAAYYAKMMGLPVAKLICASNANDVLANFLHAGVYDRRRGLQTTTSPSMDIIVSSNFERALYHLSGGDSDLVRELTFKLATDGLYTAPDTLKVAFDAHFVGGSCSDAECAEMIRTVWEQDKRLIDPHTGVALTVARENKGSRHMLAVSTASAYKFPEAVGAALDIDPAKLEEQTGEAIPIPLRGLEYRREVHKSVIDVGQMRDSVLDFVRNF